MRCKKMPYMHSFYNPPNPNISIENDPLCHGKCIKSKYQANAPYPHVNVKDRNPSYLPMLYDDYAGSISELTCSTKYIYNHLVIDSNKYPEMCEALEGIAIVEMIHLSLIGTMITQLGGDPRYWNLNLDQPSYWTPQYINFSKNPQEILLDSIKDEQLVISIYKNQSAFIYDDSILEVLKRIILDEEHHIKIFTDLYDQYFTQ